jgi:hypothetical protein
VLLIACTKLYVRFRMGEDRIIWIDPQKVRFHVGTSGPATEAVKVGLDRMRHKYRLFDKPLRLLSQAIHHSESWVIASRYYHSPEPIETERRHRLLADLVAHRMHPQDSLWYKQLCQQLEQRGLAHHKKIILSNRAEIDAFLRDYVLNLVDSLALTGYDPKRAGDTGGALIGPDGDIHKADSGNHRFCAARIVGCPKVPVQIAGVHEDWFARMVGPKMNLTRLRAALRETADRFA